MADILLKYIKQK